MRAIVLSALFGAGVLCLLPASAEAGIRKRARRCFVPACRPAPVAVCAPAAPAVSGCAVYQEGYYVEQRQAVCPPPVSYQPPCESVRPSFQLHVQIGAGLKRVPCLPPLPPLPCR